MMIEIDNFRQDISWPKIYQWLNVSSDCESKLFLISNKIFSNDSILSALITTQTFLCLQSSHFLSVVISFYDAKMFPHIYSLKLFPYLEMPTLCTFPYPISALSGVNSYYKDFLNLHRFYCFLKSPLHKTSVVHSWHLNRLWLFSILYCSVCIIHASPTW